VKKINITVSEVQCRLIQLNKYSHTLGGGGGEERRKPEKSKVSKPQKWAWVGGVPKMGKGGKNGSSRSRSGGQSNETMIGGVPSITKTKSNHRGTPAS